MLRQAEQRILAALGYFVALLAGLRRHRGRAIGHDHYNQEDNWPRTGSPSGLKMKQSSNREHRSAQKNHNFPYSSRH
jgi:hypothetical protein